MAETIANKKEQLDTENAIFQRAVSFVEDTNENFFLTGKAGTGKTTFLKYIKEHTKKQCAIVAPTGVAAMNAGGETIHSFLQLPFSPFVPGNKGGFSGVVAEDKHSLLSNLRLRETKLRLIRSLELLIIDEVSMVRCDMLDEIDLVLRHVRKSPLPFGGVQMVFIGDLFQLPPVATQEDWEILRNFYASTYFFDAHVLRENPLTYIELKKIYRQKDQAFIDILNNVRNGSVTQRDIDMLNERHSMQDEEGCIILSTHNNIADEVNRTELEKLSGTPRSFTGTIKNEFSVRNLPTEQELQLKAGAQIMFIKNDLQTPRRYYNGKVGKISVINDEGIWISFPDEDKELMLELETWKSMRYTLNTQTRQIEEEETGSFTQYPIRLAWAITVHKSQGLTLAKAKVDLSQSFAPGQVYVALSRCTSMSGLFLRSRLSMENIIVDARVLSFAQTEQDEDKLNEKLEESKRAASAAKLYRVFSFVEELSSMEEMHMELLKTKTGPKEENIQVLNELVATLTKEQKNAETFHKQIRALVHAFDDEKLKERKTAAVQYFAEKVIDPCVKKVEAHLAFLNGYTKALKQKRAWKDLHTQLKEKATIIRNLQ